MAIEGTPYTRTAVDGVGVDAAGERRPWQPWVAAICAVLSVFILPPVFGAAAIYLSFQTKKSNPGLGSKLVPASIACMVVGMVIGAFVFLAGGGF